MKYLILLSLFAGNVFANCKKYYFSLDFGGRVGDGLEISDYLVKEKVPHVIFMVGYNPDSEAKDLCQKIKSNSEYKKYIKDEILGNEKLILEKCTSDNFVKKFRYTKGESHRIAKTFDVTVEQIKEWNKRESNEIEIDQKLIIKR